MALLFALICTYLLAGVSWSHLLLGHYFALSENLSTAVFLIIFASFIIVGENITYHLNKIITFGLVVSFIATIGYSLIPTQEYFLSIVSSSGGKILPAFPLIITSFGFSIIIPSMVNYLNYDAIEAKKVIIYGSLVALVIYLLWEWAILGNLPVIGKYSLTALNEVGDNGTGLIKLLNYVTKVPWLNLTARFFAIFSGYIFFYWCIFSFAAFF